MRVRLGILAVLLTLFLPTSAKGQTKTLVTGTVTDPNGTPYAGAQLVISLVSPGGPSPTYTPCNNPSAGCQIQNPSPVTLTSTGAIPGGGINIWANASILPAATTYTFKVVLSPGVPLPLGTGPQICTVSGLTIAGASQSITTNFSGSACPALSNLPSSVPVASVTPNDGSVYIAPNYAPCPTGSTNCVQGLWDVKYVFDAACTASSPTCTCPNSDCGFVCPGSAYPCTVATSGCATPGPTCDVGKTIFSNQGPNAVASASYQAGLPQTTITTVNNANSITAAASAANNCAASASAACNMAWGSGDDTSTLATAEALAWESPGVCKELIMPSGAAFFSDLVGATPTPILYVPGTSLSQGCGGFPSGNAGQSGVDLSQTGPTVTGKGQGTTILIPLPSLTANLLARCTGGASGAACAGGTPNMAAYNFGIRGMGQPGTGTAAVDLFELDPSSGGQACTGSTGTNLALSDWGLNVSGSVGFFANGGCGDPVYYNNISELFGATNCQVNAISGGFVGNACFGFSTSALSILSGGGLRATDFTHDLLCCAETATVAQAIVGINGSAGGTFNFNGDTIYQGPSSATGWPGFRTFGGTGIVTVNLNGVTLGINSADAQVLIFSASNSARVNLHVRGSQLSAAGAGNDDLNLDAQTSFFDDGGNTWTDGSTASAFTAGAAFIADGHSVKGTCTGTATASSTLGMYGTGPNETTTTCTSTTIGAGTAVPGGSRTLAHLFVTAGTGGVNASSGVVTVLRNGSTTTITCTLGTGTACNDFIHSVAVSDGDLISLQFTTQAAETLANVKAIVEWN